MVLANVLSVGAVLMVKSFALLDRVDPGFNSENLMTMQISLAKSAYPEEPRQTAYYAELLSRIDGLSGIDSCGVSSYLPLGGGGAIYFYYLPDRPEPGPGRTPISWITAVSPGYFTAMGIRLTAGRTFADDDTNQNKQVVIMCASMAERLWPGENPIGRHVAYGAPNKTDVEVVGTVADVKYMGLDLATPDEMYVPFTQKTWPMMTLVYRASEPMAALPGVKSQVASIDPSQPLSKIRPMQELVSSAMAQPRLRTILMAVFGSMALIVAMLGIYSVLSYSVTQRTREMGIRRAIGAEGSQIIRLIVKEVLVKALVSVAIALAVSLSLAKIVSGLLFEVTPTDPAVLIGVPIAVVAVALLASYVPARRAARVDPAVALRLE